jgi:hypothetical protein
MKKFPTIEISDVVRNAETNLPEFKRGQKSPYVAALLRANFAGLLQDPPAVLPIEEMVKLIQKDLQIDEGYARRYYHYVIKTGQVVDPNAPAAPANDEPAMSTEAMAAVEEAIETSAEAPAEAETVEDAVEAEKEAAHANRSKGKKGKAKADA